MSNSKCKMVEEIQMEMEVQLPWKRSFQHLPPEMLMKIHKCLDLKSLLCCRAVSREWSVLASSVCRSRADLELEFRCNSLELELNPNVAIQVRCRKTYKEMSLAEFTELFGVSKNFPCARYTFVRVASWTFSHAPWINFLSAFGQNIKCLKFKYVKFWEISSNLTKFMEQLIHLLLNSSQLPNLQEFGLQFKECDLENSAEIPLLPFPFSSHEKLQMTESKNPDSSVSKQFQEEKPEKPTGKVQFPRLKIFYLDEFMFSKFTRIVTDLLQASPNLKKIEPFENPKCYKSIESFQFLQSLGKLDCVKMAEIKLTPAFLAKIRENPSVPLAFKLKALNLFLGSGYKSNRTLALSAIFLSNLFESSKNSLEELTTDVLGGLNGLQLPKFSKLANLKILFTLHRKPSDLFLPSGTKFVDIFPVLRVLDLENPWRTLFPQDGAHSESDLDSCSISTIPTLTSLTITDGEMDGESITQISTRCPNLKNFKVKNTVRNFPEVGRAIWTHLQKLESMELKVDVHTTANAFPAIDSCILGFSLEDCLRLYNLYQMDTVPEGDGAKFPRSKLNLNLNRINPSILDLKDLKYFEIRLAFSYSAIESGRRKLMNQAMNQICEDHAFGLMEKLSHNIYGRR